MSLYDTLDSLNSDDLRKRIGKLGFTAKEIPTRKADRLQFLLDYLLSDQLQNIVDQLSSAEKAVIAEVVHNQGGVVNDAQLRARLGSLPQGYEQELYSRWNYQYRYDKPPKKVKSMVGALLFGHRIPAELCEPLSVLLPKPAPDEVKITATDKLDEIIAASPANEDSRPLYRREMEAPARQELFTLLRLIDKGKVSVSDKTRKPSASAIKQINAELLGGDFFSAEDEDYDPYDKDRLSPIRAYSWPLLIQCSGLARYSGGKLTLSKTGKAVLGQQINYADAIKQCYIGWRDQDQHDEMQRVNRVKGQTRRSKGRRAGSMMTPPSTRRSLLDGILSETPLGEWIQIDEWLRYIRANGLPLSVSDNPYMLYLVDSNYGSIGTSFMTLEARYVLAYLFEALATLGMLDVVYSAPHGVRGDYGDNWGADQYDYLSRYDGLGWFRINPLGAYCLGLSESYQALEETLPPLLHHHDGLSYSLLRAPEPHERMLLEQFAIAESAPAGAIYRLDMQQALNAVDAGQEPDELKKLLQNAADATMHEEVEDFLDSLNMRTTSLRNGGSARIIECSGEHLLQLLATAKETAKFCLFSGNGKVVVAEKSYTAFLKGLHKLGYRIRDMEVR